MHSPKEKMMIMAISKFILVLLDLKYSSLASDLFCTQSKFIY